MSPESHNLIKRYTYIVENHRVLTRPEEKELLFNAINNDCSKSRDLLAIHNRKFAVSIAYRLHNTTFRHVPVVDLIGYSMLGLFQAIEKYDLKYLDTIKFSSHAVWWIRQAINNMVFENENAIRIPVNKLADIRKELKETKYQTTGELSDQYKNLLTNARSMPSIDEPLGDEQMLSKSDIYSMQKYSESMHDLDNTLDQTIIKKELMSVISMLPEKHADIIHALYGTKNGGKLASMREVGAEVGLSHERVRKIRDKAFSILKKRLAHLR